MLLRRIIGSKWDEQSEIPISNSEWYMISRIYKKATTISEISKSVNISRQATHKVIKKLEEKQLVIVSDHEQNKRLKNIQLTKLGDACFEQYSILVRQVEQKIIVDIGEQQFTALKDILKIDWKVDQTV